MIMNFATQEQVDKNTNDISFLNDTITWKNLLSIVGAGTHTVQNISTYREILVIAHPTHGKGVRASNVAPISEFIRTKTDGEYVYSSCSYGVNIEVGAQYVNDTSIKTLCNNGTVSVYGR